MTESLCFYVLQNCCVDFSLKNQNPKEITLTCFKCPYMLDILLSNWLPELQSYKYDFYLIFRHDTDCLFLKALNYLSGLDLNFSLILNAFN